MALTSWYVGTTKSFSGAVTIGAVTPDISQDEVTLRLKTTKSDADANAVLSKAADCATSGAAGIYLMEIAPAETAGVAPGSYHYDIVLVRSAGASNAQYILELGEITLLERVSDP
jgi:hypothetical protein